REHRAPHRVRRLWLPRHRAWRERPLGLHRLRRPRHRPRRPRHPRMGSTPRETRAALDNPIRPLLDHPRPGVITAMSGDVLAPSRAGDVFADDWILTPDLPSIVRCVARVRRFDARLIITFTDETYSVLHPDDEVAIEQIDG